MTQGSHAFARVLPCAQQALQSKRNCSILQLKRQAILFQKRLIHSHHPYLHPQLPQQVKVHLDASDGTQKTISIMHISLHLKSPPILIHKFPILPATISPLFASAVPDPLSGGLFTWHAIILIKAMQKTKLISKDFIRDCRTTREHERRETTHCALPTLPSCHSLFTHDDHYSIEDFILNLQSEELLYYNDPSDSPPLLASPRRPSIQQINHQYQQRMADCASPSKPSQQHIRGAVVSFERELRAKYFKEEDQPSIIGGNEEYVYECEENEQGSWGMEFI